MSQAIFEYLVNTINGHPQPGIIKELLTNQIDGIITPESLKKAISENIDLIQLSLEKSGVNDFPLKPLFKRFARCNWSEIEYYLTNAQRVYDIINRNPSCGALLDMPQGNLYLNNTCKRTYIWLYNYLWM